MLLTMQLQAIMESTKSQVPIIDLNKLMMSPGSDDELNKLHSACKEWGIFQLVNHGVRCCLVKSEVEEFYKLPLEEKMKFKVREGEFEGYGTKSSSSSSRNIIDWCDRFYMITNPIHKRNPHLLPQLPSPFRDTLESYLTELQKLAMKLLEVIIVKNLRMDLKEMTDLFEDGMQSMRMTYYPMCPQPESVMGFRPHSDGTCITILNQLNGVDGLQVKKDGVWLPVSFLPNALIVNVGDILEIVSNGEYHSIEHRAAINSEKERKSIAFFVSPKFEAEVGPTAISLIDNPPKFKRISMENYVKGFFSRELIGRSYLETMRLKETTT